MLDPMRVAPVLGDRRHGAGRDARGGVRDRRLRMTARVLTVRLTGSKLAHVILDRGARRRDLGRRADFESRARAGRRADGDEHQRRSAWSIRLGMQSRPASTIEARGRFAPGRQPQPTRTAAAPEIEIFVDLKDDPDLSAESWRRPKPAARASASATVGDQPQRDGIRESVPGRRHHRDQRQLRLAGVGGPGDRTDSARRGAGAPGIR